MNEPKGLHPEDLPDPDYDALLKKLGLVHVAEAVQADGEIILLRDQIVAELKKALLAQVDNLYGESEEKIESIIDSICCEHADRFEERARAVLSDYFTENTTEE